MDYNFFLLTTFILRTEDNGAQKIIRCLGSREILKVNREVPEHILGVIEFESAFIPVVDLAAAFGNEPVVVDNSRCILIVKHNYKSHKLVTGVIIQDLEEIDKLAAGFFTFGAGLGASANMHFLLEMQNGYNDGHEILIETHRILSLLEEPIIAAPQGHSRSQLCDSYDFINELEKMNFSERQFILEELWKKHQLWDKESNVMCL